MRKTVLCLLLLLTVGSARAESELHYKIPEGWSNVMAPNVIANHARQSVLKEAASDKYALFAIDPQRATDQGAPVSLNVVEGTSIGRVTEGLVRRAAVEMSHRVGALGATVNIQGIKMTKLDGVDIGVVDCVVETPRGSSRMIQYMIPSRTKMAVLTYVCPLPDYDHYRPIFQSSAMATTGAYDPSAINIPPLSIFGAIVAAILAVIIVMRAADNGKTESAARAGAFTPPVTWACPTCKRRVPMRVTQCRCGTPQPV